ncbi:hypothetical protein L6452_06183 [Arctium lappa]|uniref:Uncharacterized protein n=1 Tax=Arctium lappa TaxID=4217 RepID=A0ACB9EIS9_ARCLA|nr:hypothetical protein L6452_06183 [Arctium lappa]
MVEFVQVVMVVRKIISNTLWISDCCKISNVAQKSSCLSGQQLGFQLGKWQVEDKEREVVGSGCEEAVVCG